ncbi:MAG: hypothetical protein Q4E47_01795 [Candidatus Saccharibacteria bacterium]|nr:hypothetical protein [Candidatus Saccharibacteria bacterium]
MTPDRIQEAEKNYALENPYARLEEARFQSDFIPGQATGSTAKAFGELLKHEMQTNSKFYLFSPDETTSNKLDATYEASGRAWSNLRQEPWDLKEIEDGRIVELLSENTLFAAMIGHLLSGEPAMMTSYESFFNIITSQIVQHIKFLKQAKNVTWREAYPSVNLLSTSTCWRQDHNGFSHQSPLLMSSLLSIPNAPVNLLFPVDAKDAENHFRYMMTSDNAINLCTFNKSDEPIWLENADSYVPKLVEPATVNSEITPARIFGFASHGDSITLESHANDTFNLIFTAAGDIATRESLYAMKILKTDLPKLKMRFINIPAISQNKIGTIDNPLSQADFDRIFKVVPPIIASFHGYPALLRNVLENYAPKSRLSVHGYEEQGSTTTPYEMLMLNHASRYDLAVDAATRLGRADLIRKYQTILDASHDFSVANGLDHRAITDFKF